MHSEILAIGDEVVSGRILDTNSHWLSQRLEELGVRVLYHTAVGDNLEAMVDCFARAIDRADVVIATGGLGPTADDITRNALAKATGRKLALKPEVFAHIRNLFARYQRPMPPSNGTQALFPDGAAVVDNPDGTAPGIELTVPREGRGPCTVIALPGVPAEMRQMWHGSLVGILQRLGAGAHRIVHKQVKCFGIGESQLESMLPAGFFRHTDPVVGINASQATMILRIAARGASDEECRAKMRPVIDVIRTTLGSAVFGEDDDELETVVLRLLRDRRQTLATAEWGTAGLVADWLGARDREGAAFAGGMVVTSAGSFRDRFSQGDTPFNGCAVDAAAAARAMAEGIRVQFSTDYGLAVGPFPVEDARAKEAAPPVFLALASAGEVQMKQLPFALHPDLRRVYLAKHALNMVRLAVA